MIKLLCICDVCQHAWLAMEVPNKCSNCKKRGWNGHKRANPVGKVVLKEPVESNGADSDTLPVLSPFSALEAITEWPKPVAELADTGEPYKRSEGALADKLKAALADPKPAKSPYCRHGLAYHPGCNA